MVERHGYDDEESKKQDFTTSKNNPKLDTAEILRRQGPEFEPPKEDITEKERYVVQDPSRTTVGPSTGPADQANDQTDQQKKDAELAQEIEQLTQNEEALKSQELPKLRERLQQIQQEKEQEAQQSNSETDQSEDYHQGMGQ